MGDFTKKTQSDNSHLANATTARFAYIDGSKPQVVVRPKAGRLLRIIINTVGLTLNVRNGTEIIAQLPATAIGTFNYGVYCSNNITIDVGGSGGNATVAFAE